MSLLCFLAPLFYISIINELLLVLIKKKIQIKGANRKVYHKIERRLKTWWFI
jgi:hypothetical protein